MNIHNLYQGHFENIKFFSPEDTRKSIEQIVDIELDTLMQLVYYIERIRKVLLEE